MIITLYPTNGAVTLLENGHTRTLTPENPEDNTAQSDLTDVSPLVKEMCQSLWAIPRNESGRKVQFNSATCTIQAGSDKITPETDLSDYPEEVRTFAETIFSYDPNEQGEGRYSEIWRLANMEGEPDEPITTTEDVYDADGVTVIDQKEIPVMETVVEPVDVKMEGKWIRLNRPFERQKIKKGKRVPGSVKTRLQELKAKSN